MQLLSRIGFKPATAAAVTAVALVATFASPAHAVLVYSGPVNIGIPDNIDGVYFNVVTGVSGTSGLSVPGWDINPYSAVTGSSFNLWGPTTTTWLSPSGVVGGTYTLAEGTSIGAAGAYFRPGGATNVGLQVTLNDSNLFGFRFTNEATGATNYGWIEVTFGSTVGSRAITGYAYDNAGGAVLAGVVPEPGTVALMLAGLAGVGAAARRARKAA